MEKEALEARGLTEDDLWCRCEVLSAAQMGELMEEQDVVLSVFEEERTMLHIVNKSPLERHALDSCLRSRRPAAPCC